MAAIQETGDQDTEELGEIQVAEYVILLLAILSYKLYVEKRLGEGEEDGHLRDGIKLIRLMDSHDRNALSMFFDDKLSRPTSKAQVARSFKVHISNAEQAGRRAVTIRAALRTGGTSTLQSVFDEARARRAVKECVAASYLADFEDVFAEYASHPFRNFRIKRWVKTVREVIGTGAPVNPVEKAAAAVVDQAQNLKKTRVEDDVIAEVEDVQEAQATRAEAFVQLQSDATEAARDAIEASGEDDSPPTKSEVIGIATAAAAAAAAGVGDKSNIAPTLRGLDPEQLAAALTDGRVLVAAGAGAGKSTTLVSRVAYLVKERNVDPSRMLVSSFSKDSADELAHKIAESIGDEPAARVKVGTLHSVFRGLIHEYGTAAEKAMFALPPRPAKRNVDGEEDGSAGKGSKDSLSGVAVAGAVNRIWRKCFAEPNGQGALVDADVPSAAEMMRIKTRWAGNGVTPAMAKANAETIAERQAALWYEMYEGLKGAIPNWRPACDKRPDAQFAFDSFMRSNRVRYHEGRAVTVRLGDYDDMISVCREILVRAPAARQSIHKQFDHIMIDECQDLNTVQNDALMMMTEHIGRDEKTKSFWMVGDDKQSIYEFRGAQPGQFTARAYEDNTKLRLIRTNYRCAPEVVEAANKLISHNVNQIQMEANPSPTRQRGQNSIRVNVYEDEASVGIAVADQIKDAWDDGAVISEQAILCRTQKELNAFETALLMRGVPYARRGASSFLTAPDTKAFLGYINLVSESDAEKTQAALVDIINTPNRFFTKAKGEELRRAVDNAIHNYARRMRLSKKSVNGYEALRDYQFQADFMRIIGVTREAEGHETFRDLITSLEYLQEIADREDATTKELFDEVLRMPGVELTRRPGSTRAERVMVSFGQVLTDRARDYGGDDEDEDAPPDSSHGEGMRLGNVAFLYELAKTDENDPVEVGLPPTTPKGFWAKMERLKEKADELRIDLNKWSKAQKKLPFSKREKKPAGVYLGTIHSTKGAQWDNVYLQMPGGRFPLVRRPKDGEEVTEKMILEEQAKMESERRLAYVALTRPKENLRIVAPKVYQGKPAGLSPFVYEAGLNVGENVVKPGSEAEMDSPPRTAMAFFEDHVPAHGFEPMEAY